MKNWVFRFVLPLFIFPVYALLRFSWRIREHGPDHVLKNYIWPRKPMVFAHWHGDELALIGYYSFRGLAVLTSHSDDGTLMASTLTLLGYKVFRGSSSRGGARGLIGLIKAARAGRQTSLAVDGPKGPIYQVKPGIIDLAERTGLPIFPIHSKASHAWKIPRAWNQSYVPKPFAKVDIFYSEPIFLDKADWKDKSVEDKCLAIKIALDGLKALPENF